ncbi:MAG: ATP-binding protein [Cohaesibacter sp.]|nr:ATP-binding protein [Cohaesibacter sp.]MCV6603281.1 ATP-binding protein [Cohaesibacter sp.]
MFKSLSSRLVAYASLWATICIFIAGILITDNFHQSMEKDLDRRLNVSVKLLVAHYAAQLVQNDTLDASGNLGDPLFDLPLSGWYWSIASDQGEVLVASASLASGTFNLNKDQEIAFDESNQRYGLGIGPDQQELRILERKISFGPDRIFLFRISGNAQDLQNRSDAFKADAWLTMAFVVALPLLSIVIVVRLVFKPLSLLQDKIREVRQGKADQIIGSYPDEISGLVDEANALIRSNAELAERARMQVGNLAHALKTPLSVITNEANEMDGKIGPRLQHQAQTMRDQINLYLERARMAARSNMLGAATPLEPILRRLSNVMQKIHSSSDLSISVSIEDNLTFRGEEQDLEEMVGNLVDNACKWARHNVSIRACCILFSDGEKKENPFLKIIIEDDGPGLSRQECEEVKRRGYRLDESKPGSGLGLSIVDELAHLYKGSFTLSVSELGGLKVELELPAL